MTRALSAWPAMHLNPIGLVRSSIHPFPSIPNEADMNLRDKKEIIRSYHQRVQEHVSELVISSDWDELLDGIDGLSHILVLYWPHLIMPEKRNIRRVHPMGRLDVPPKGIFATCSPARPNPVLVSTVRLLKRNENILKVQGLEAEDGSPIIDVKPYVTLYYGAANPSLPDWMDQIQQDLNITGSGPK
jgi:tRNA (adenine37-N6)-methyltransferase